MRGQCLVRLTFGRLQALGSNRAGRPLKAVLERTHWHSRLLYGSDYPLPGVMPLFSVDFLVRAGYLDAATGAVLTEVRKINPLLFSFALARHRHVRAWLGSAAAGDQGRTEQEGFFHRWVG